MTQGQGLQASRGIQSLTLCSS